MIQAPAITSRKIGNGPSGTEVSEWTLTGAGGLRVSVMNYGAIVTELHVPRAGKESLHVVLGFKDKTRYFGEHPCFGAMVGRIAGRVTGGRLTYDKHDILLEQNDRGNTYTVAVMGFTPGCGTPSPLQMKTRWGCSSP